MTGRPHDLLAAAFARVGYGTTKNDLPPAIKPGGRSSVPGTASPGLGAERTASHENSGGPVKITHPVKGYTGPVRGAVRLDFVNGQAEDTNLSAAQRKALEAAGFKVESTRAAKAPEGD